MSTRTREIPSALTQADNLPSLPAVAIEILRLTSSDDVQLSQLSDAIGRDPALAGKMLKLANSAMFSTGASEITTLQRAVMQLGMKTVKLMSLSFSLVGAVPSKSSGGFDIDQYWMNSLVGAVCGRQLMSKIGSMETDEAFLCGLLGHLGKLVMSQVMPDLYAPLAGRNSGWPTIEEEEQELGFHSSDVVAALLEAWELPAQIVEPVTFMLEPSAVPANISDESRRLTNVMHVAQLATGVQCGREPGVALAAFHEATKEHFGWDQEAADEFLLELEDGIQETASLLDVNLDGRQSPDQILNEARNQMIMVSLGTAADLNTANRRTQELETRADVLQQKATTDALTGLPNRAAYDEFLAEQVAERMNGPVPRALGIILIDIDKFKVFNDTHGHDAGDEVLRMVGHVFGERTRRIDLSARYGGEEFVLICPQTNPFGLKTLAERLRQAIEGAVVMYDGKQLRVTASFGAACITHVEDELDGKKLLKLADHYLYKAKENGRNRCEIYPKMKLPGSK